MQDFGFVLGQNEHGDEVVVHLNTPRFTARVAEVGEDGRAAHPDEDADLLSGLVYSGDGFALCELELLDAADLDDPAALSGTGPALRAAAALVAALRASTS